LEQHNKELIMKNLCITFAAIVLTLGFLAFPQRTQAVVPAPDGGYPGGNTAEGQNALLSLNVNAGINNTAVGWFSLKSNIEGQLNTAVGAGTLFNNTASTNTAIGGAAMFSNTGGNSNTAVGMLSLFTNSTGYSNTAIGDSALFHNTTGNGNTANGISALRSNTTGTLNTAVGGGAGANITGSGNVCIGQGVLGEADVNERTYIRNINTTVQSFSAGVNDYVTVRLSDGRLGHTQVVSSQRYKEDIKPLATSSQALYALNPVSFRLKKEFDPGRALGFGLIAEEVEKVDPTLVYRNGKGQVESVRYDMVNAMLLNEFLKEHRKVEQLTRDFESKLAKQEKQIEALTAGLQKVSAQLAAASPSRGGLEASKFATGRIRGGGPAPQVVNNP
jgi:Chaperone of endosialidase